MADHTKIEWTDATWNPITGCSVVSPGCTNCYAMRLAGTRLQHHPSRAGLTRETKAGPVWNGTMRFNEEWLTQPLRWKRPRMVFVCAHGDLFHEDVPDEWIDKVFAVMALAPHHTYQVLTKRAARMRAYVEEVIRSGRWLLWKHPELGHDIFDPFVAQWQVMLRKVWLGVSAEDQVRWNQRVSELRRTPAAVRFVSAEPLLGPVQDDMRGLDWIIVGGEAGSGARPMHPDWARQVRDQCSATGTAFFFKQHGDWIAFYDRDRDDPDWRRCPRVDDQMGRGAERYHNLAGGTGFHGERVLAMRNVGKAKAGRLLDGIEHNAMPRSTLSTMGA